jgi:hypothetical protein
LLSCIEGLAETFGGVHHHFLGAGRLHQRKAERASHRIVAEPKDIAAGRRGAEIPEHLAREHGRQPLAEVRLSDAARRDCTSQPAATAAISRRPSSGAERDCANATAAGTMQTETWI